MIAVIGAVLAGLAYYDSHRTTDIALEDKNEEDKLEAGIPLLASPGASWFGANWRASEKVYSTIGGKRFPGNGPEIWEWLDANVVDMGRTGTSITVESRHKTTVLIHGAEVTDVKCRKPLTGTVVSPPAIGDGGEEVLPVMMGFSLDAPRPVARSFDDSGSLGDPFKGQIALDKGDAREFVFTFESARKSCTFRAGLIVSSQGKKRSIPIPATWKDGNKPDSYVFEVTAPAGRYSKAYVTDGSSDTEWQFQEVDPHKLVADGLRLIETNGQ
ncbi:hypothetical protein [Streptomyces sp. FIT100]|uniref:hypothetical protein n=1 Tax=Streptomyces sp. FIT100 TaxID=2837956 RepID=UPI0021C80FD2|nr:hypothetical protein [Streptomyces sp. FIT100]UUN29804.1 hypothetical protein KK483_28075 [Streptomyces sp. FIT100]